jgi:hypothetical protein
MATTTEVGVKITVDGSEATKSVGSIKSQLKEATAELIEMRQKFGDTSDEAVAAAKKVANLKDEIGDAKAMTDAFNPDAKFKAFGAALQGVAGGFSAVQGAMGLMGAESSEVEQMLLKVNSAMALSQGIDSVFESVDAFGTLGKKLMSFSIIQKVVTVAQQVFNAVMRANPIGVMITAITALIAGVALLTKYFMDNAKAAKFNEASVKANAKALEAQQKATAKAGDELNRAQNYQLAMAKANGATTASIRALELKLIDEKIATERASRETAINTFEKNKNALASLKQSGASDEVIKKQKETVGESLKYANDQTANLNKSLVDRVELTRKHNVEIASEQTNANKEASQKRNQDNADAIAKRNKANEDRKKQNEDFAKELRALEDKNFIDAIKDENRKADELLTQQFLNDIKELNASTLNEEQKNAKRIELGKQYQIQIDAINAKRIADAKVITDKEDADALVKRDKEIAFEEGTFKILNDLRISQIKSETDRARENEALRYQADIDANYKALNDKEITQAEFDARAEANKKLNESKISDIQKTESENRIKQDELERKTKIDSAKAIGDSLGALSDLVGKQTATGKALGVAQALINTYIGASEVLRAKSVLPEPIGTISKVVNVATIIATGIKSVKAIIGTKVPNAGGGGGGGVSTPSIPAITPPLPPQLQTQMINGGQVNQLASATARAYVVESDVSGNQERINRLNRASRIN